MTLPLRARRLALPALSLLLAFGLLALVVYWSGPRQTLATLGRLGPGAAVVLLATAFAAALCTSLAWQAALARYGHGIPAWLLFRLVVLVFAVGWVIPSGFIAGLPLAGLLLRRHGVPATRGIATFVVARFFALTAYALVLPTVLLGEAPLGPGGRLALFAPLAALVLVYLDLVLGWRLARRGLGALGPVVPRRLHAARDRGLELLATVGDFFRDAPGRLVVLAVAYSFLATALDLGRAFLVTHLLGLGLTVAEVVLMFAFTVLLLAVPLLPGAIGVYEGGIVGLFRLIGHTPADGLAYAAVVHALELVLVAVGFGFLAQLGFSAERLVKLSRS